MGNNLRDVVPKCRSTLVLKVNCAIYTRCKHINKVLAIKFPYCSLTHVFNYFVLGFNIYLHMPPTKKLCFEQAWQNTLKPEAEFEKKELKKSSVFFINNKE